MNSTRPEAWLLLYHQQAASALVRFLRLPWGVTLFHSLPDGTRLLHGESHVSPHPVAWGREVARWLGLPGGAVSGDAGFRLRLAMPDGSERPVVLLKLTDIDLPLAAAERRHGKFVTLMEARDLADAELTLLRASYEHLLGG